MQSLTLILIILLVLTALLGGGLSIREFKLLKANTGVRIAAILTGLILWMIGSAFQPNEAKFTVINNLTQGAISERVDITVQRKKIGFITSNSSVPRSTKEFTVPKPGEYSYSVELSGTYNNNGQEASFYGEGSGTINVFPGDAFEVQREVSNNNLIITLTEK
ncbi:hypothetical protein ACQ4M3_06340 [Leptolyngbya sp. AN03gr2]|uniref:hypothetical protein n=1 Tax=unclassified Leptolyngbya TaxID=2650499 RepID=UPI003D31D7B7